MLEEKTSLRIDLINVFSFRIMHISITISKKKYQSIGIGEVPISFIVGDDVVGIAIAIVDTE